MSTYTHTDYDGDKLEIDAYEGEVIIGIRSYSERLSVSIQKADVPRVALELGLAAGLKAGPASALDDGTAEWASGEAMYRLNVAANRREAVAEAARRAEAEAADKNRLDQEAQKLGRAMYPDTPWACFSEDTKNRLHAVALAARELHKDGTK